VLVLMFCFPRVGGRWSRPFLVSRSPQTSTLPGFSANIQVYFYFFASLRAQPP
jgi:hypothetical protein